jgi:hypothetical protein
VKVSRYYRQYTDVKDFHLGYLLEELGELFLSLFTFRASMIRDEVGDVSIYLQLWFYLRFRHDGELWRTTLINLEKVRLRKPVWKCLYRSAGVRTTSNYCGNCYDERKVLAQLRSLGASEAAARRAYTEVVVPLLSR